MLFNLKPLIVIWRFLISCQQNKAKVILVCLTTKGHGNILIGARQKLARKSHTLTLVLFLNDHPLNLREICNSNHRDEKHCSWRITKMQRTSS